MIVDRVIKGAQEELFWKCVKGDFVSRVMFRLFGEMFLEVCTV